MKVDINIDPDKIYRIDLLSKAVNAHSPWNCRTCEDIEQCDCKFQATLYGSELIDLLHDIEEDD